jgi:hypothetical protein
LDPSPQRNPDPAVAARSAQQRCTAAEGRLYGLAKRQRATPRLEDRTNFPSGDKGADITRQPGPGRRDRPDNHR